MQFIVDPIDCRAAPPPDGEKMYQHITNKTSPTAGEEKEYPRYRYGAGGYSGYDSEVAVCGPGETAEIGEEYDSQGDHRGAERRRR